MDLQKRNCSLRKRAECTHTSQRKSKASDTSRKQVTQVEASQRERKSTASALIRLIDGEEVPQSALLPPDLVMAEMKAVGVMLEKATCIIIPCSTKSMSKPLLLLLSEVRNRQSYMLLFCLSELNGSLYLDCLIVVW